MPHCCPLLPRDVDVTLLRWFLRHTFYVVLTFPSPLLFVPIAPHCRYRFQTLFVALRCWIDALCRIYAFDVPRVVVYCCCCAFNVVVPFVYYVGDSPRCVALLVTPRCVYYIAHFDDDSVGWTQRVDPTTHFFIPVVPRYCSVNVVTPDVTPLLLLFPSALRLCHVYHCPRTFPVPHVLLLDVGVDVTNDCCCCWTLLLHFYRTLLPLHLRLFAFMPHYCPALITRPVTLPLLTLLLYVVYVCNVGALCPFDVWRYLCWLLFVVALRCAFGCPRTTLLLRCVIFAFGNFRTRVVAYINSGRCTVPGVDCYRTLRCLLFVWPGVEPDYPHYWPYSQLLLWFSDCSTPPFVVPNWFNSVLHSEPFHDVTLPRLWCTAFAYFVTLLRCCPDGLTLRLRLRSLPRTHTGYHDFVTTPPYPTLLLPILPDVWWFYRTFVRAFCARWFVVVTVCCYHTHARFTFTPLRAFPFAFVVTLFILLVVVVRLLFIWLFTFVLVRSFACAHTHAFRLPRTHTRIYQRLPPRRVSLRAFGALHTYTFSFPFPVLLIDVHVSWLFPVPCYYPIPRWFLQLIVLILRQLFLLHWLVDITHTTLIIPCTHCSLIQPVLLIVVGSVSSDSSSSLYSNCVVPVNWFMIFYQLPTYQLIGDSSWIQFSSSTHYHSHSHCSDVSTMQFCVHWLLPR